MWVSAAFCCRNRLINMDVCRPNDSIAFYTRIQGLLDNDDHNSSGLHYSAHCLAVGNLQCGPRNSKSTDCGKIFTFLYTRVGKNLRIRKISTGF